MSVTSSLFWAGRGGEIRLFSSAGVKSRDEASRLASYPSGLPFMHKRRNVSHSGTMSVVQPRANSWSCG